MERSGLVLWGLYHMYIGKWWSPAQLIMDTIIFFLEGEGEAISFISKLSHSFAPVAFILLALSWTPVTWV